MSAVGGSSMAEASAICLAILGAGSGVLAAALGGAIPMRSRKRALGSASFLSRDAGRRVVSTPPFPARAGPAVLQVLRC